MRVRVRLFAVARELAGQDSIEVEVAAGGSIGDLRRALGVAVPALAPWLPYLLFAVGNEYSGEGATIGSEEEIACIPPVSGG